MFLIVTYAMVNRIKAKLTHKLAIFHLVSFLVAIVIFSGQGDREMPHYLMYFVV